MGKLCIIAPELGASFVDKHLNRIRPGETVAVVWYDRHPHAKMFQNTCPTLHLDAWAQQLSVRLARRAGLSLERMRARAVTRFLRSHDVEVVLGEFMDYCLEFVPLLERLGIPLVVQAHGYDVSGYLRGPRAAQEYLAYRSAKAILTRSEFHRRRLIELGLPTEKVHVNPGGVDIAALPPIRGADAAYRLLAIGRMVPQKAPIMLLEAFRLAAAREPRLMLDYVGHGPMFDAVRMFITACGLEDRVLLHGTASEETKHRLLLECGVFVQHSVTVPDVGNEEGLPAAIQEAMGAAMAVVSTRHTGIPEAVVENEMGLLVDEGDVQGMAEAFLRIAPLVEEFGQAGYRKAAATYTWEHEKARLERSLGCG